MVHPERKCPSTDDWEYNKKPDLCMFIKEKKVQVRLLPQENVLLVPCSCMNGKPEQNLSLAPCPTVHLRSPRVISTKTQYIREYMIHLTPYVAQSCCSDLRPYEHVLNILNKNKFLTILIEIRCLHFKCLYFNLHFLIKYVQIVYTLSIIMAIFNSYHYYQ